MNRDRIERALREPGPREQGYSPEPLPATAAELRARSPRRRGLLMSAGAFGGLAAAVAAGAVVALVLVRGFGGGSNTGGTVPTPSPTPEPATVGACHAGDFSWTADVWGGAAGSRGTTIQAVAGATCWLDGEMTLVLRDANNSVVVSGKTAVTNTKVARGSVYAMGVTWSNWCAAEPFQPLTFTLTLPGDTTAVPVTPPEANATPPCNGTGQPSTLSGTDLAASLR